ncbi:DUF1330 domain-containing protein [Amycolatopsis granulosa]|uniref:DUF1330 domain-containing protein n=1 Tax=Amycolatopsis granulosa TaxID=185684 RepID=UPI001422BBCA|nr:DUF1330 domain-containing protein [Amycolatopsis granulosa]NIH87625.1 uncharacterized protein (DUF1330 family) [Amycolatopsis granulosa]
MPAYVIVTVEVLDEEAGLAYARVAQRSILDHGGRYLVAGPTPEPVEGTWEAPRLVILEFPDMDRSREWYDSPEYRQARKIREGTVRVSMLFVEGAPPEGFTLPG